MELRGGDAWVRLLGRDDVDGIAASRPTAEWCSAAGDGRAFEATSATGTALCERA